MVKVKNPLQCVQASGKAGDLIFARNHYGAYARDYVSPTQPGSGAQLAWQAAMAQANAWFQDITVVTPVRLQLWQEFSKNYTWKNRFGNQVHLNAKEWFVKFNIWGAAKGLSAVTDPPKSPATYWFPEVTIFWDTGGIYAEVFPRPTSTRWVHFRRSQPQSHTRNFCPQDLEWAANFDSTSTGPVLLVAAASIDTDPHNWFFRVKTIDEFGRTSNALYFKVYTEGTAPTSVFLPSGNTYLDFPNTTSNRSTAQRVRFRNDVEGSTTHGLIELDLSGLSYSYVDKSYFYIYPESVSSINGKAELFQDLSSYVNSETTWIEESTGVDWSVPGGSSGVDYESIPFSSLTADSSTLQWFRFDITNQMNLWLSGTTPTRFWGLCPDSNVNFSFESINNAVTTERCFILNVPNVAV